MLPYWLQQTLAATPLVLWVTIALGVPWALWLLPRQDWSQRLLVLGVGFVAGPMLLTAWMFVLGVAGGARGEAWLRFDATFAGTVVLVVLGVGLAWVKSRRTQPPEKRPAPPLVWDEKVLILLLVGALLLRWVVTAFWPFTAYDPLWVYGYQARLYILHGFIPPEIGYYPQFLQLQYTFQQLFAGGFDDHAARAVIPFLHLGSVLATYLLGTRLFWRRAGILAAAIWGLSPHVGNWAYVGDLEVPLAFLLSMTALFAVSAWMSESAFLRRRYALIAGLIFGVAMWTKPTAGAFILGMALLVTVELLRVRFRWRAWLPRLEVAVIMGLATIPLGSVWYLRNALLGHEVLVFPHESWLSLATRSGDLLSWPLLALLLLLAYLAATQRLQRGNILLLIGSVLVLAGAMPSSPLLNPARRDPPASYISAAEWGMLVAGLGLIAWHLRKYGRVFAELSLGTVGWLALLVAPYFVVWFHSYSYHARLAFAITPVMILPVALLLATWFPAQRMAQCRWFVKGLGVLLLLLVGLPAAMLTLYAVDRHDDWLWVERYPDDYAKYRAQNPSVFRVAEFLWSYQQYENPTVVVVAPGEQRLPFFLPDATFITDTVPTTYAELAGATHYLYGTQARWRYDDAGIAPEDNQIVASLGRDDVMTQIVRLDEGIFSYELYELHLENRFIAPEDSRIGHLLEDEVFFGDFVRYWGDNVSNTDFATGTVALEFLWEVLDTPPQDYTLQVSLYYEPEARVVHTWEVPFAPGEHGSYQTSLWEPGEFIINGAKLQLQDVPPDVPRGSGYRLLLNFVNPQTGEPLPVSRNGEALPDGYPMVAPYRIGADP